MKFDIYEEITNRIIEMLNNGIIPWNKPWGGVLDMAISYDSRKPYSLLNQMLLGEAGEFITFKKCNELGGHVKKGAKSKMVVFWKMIREEKKDENGNVKRDENGDIEYKTIPVLKYFNVFNIRDCEGIEPHTKEELVNAAGSIEEVETVFADYLKRSGCKFENVKGNKAYYSPSHHKIVLPLREQFISTEEYYGTLFHEATHSTGHKSLLNRFESGSAAAAFGSESYSKEELVAEIGSAAILRSFGIDSTATIKNSAAYIQSWLQVLKNDKKFIVSATARAEKAVNLILNEQ